MQAVAYIRVSTDKQENGPEVQRASIEAWAQLNKAQVIGWFDDNGSSGGLDVAGRPGLAKAIQGVRIAGEGSVLVVAKRDRLARDVVVALAVERELSMYGGHVVCADGTPCLEGEPREDPTGWLFVRFMDLLAEYERILIGHRTSAALQSRKAQGFSAGQCSWGKTKAEDGRLVDQPTEMLITARARELRDQGLSLAKVAETLNREGHRTRGGGLFGPPKVMRMLDPPKSYYRLHNGGKFMRKREAK